MADIIIDCPSCKQPIQADDAWTGQQIVCPLCQSPMIVPEAQSPGAPGAGGGRELGKQLVSVPAETKLSAGAIQVPRQTAERKVMPGGMPSKTVKRPNPVVRYTLIGSVVLGLAASGWVAWPYVKPYLPFLKKPEDPSASAAASPPAAPNPGTDAVGTETAASPPKEVPMTPPEYTLDIAKAKIPGGKVNGSIAGTNFVPDLVRLDKSATGYVLTMRQGPGQTPNRGPRMYIQFSPTESPTGHTWTVSQDMKGAPISSVVKVWKSDPKYAAQEKSFTTGFALQLELGQVTASNTITGKMYAALPDTEQTVVAGAFNAATTLAGSEQTAAEQPGLPGPQTGAQKAEFQRRYGVRRP